jgi:soluble lytic murein transglycosylase
MGNAFRLLIVLFAALAAQARAAEASPGRPELATAFDLADRGLLEPAQLPAYASSPAYPWLQAATLRGRIQIADPHEVEILATALGDSPAGAWLREGWLRELVRREDWAAFHAAWTGGKEPLFRCADLMARAGATDAAWISEAQSVWLTGNSLPDLCDRVFDRLGRLGALTADLRWQRIDLAIAEGRPGLVRGIAKGLTGADGKLALAYVGYLAAPAGAVPGDWPRTARTRSMLVAAWSGLAKRDPAGAAALLQRLGPGFGIDAGQQGKVLHDIALWSAASYLPDAKARLAAVPAANYDDALYEWRVREAIARADDADALAALAVMPERQRADPHWLYYEARLRERRHEPDAAQALYRKAAGSANFYGWLAADHLRGDYALCAKSPSTDAALKARVDANPGLTRAFELVALGRPELAAREWVVATKGMGDDERRLAVQRALQQGWYDRAVFGMGSAPDDLQQYGLRFPLHHEDDLRAQARINDLDPAWVAGQARAESSFMPGARSSADARGLLQLLPATGERTARRLGMPWQGGDSLFDPVTNLTLGTAYLRQLLDRYNGAPYLAIAAYNAGPEVVDRWRQARSWLDPDFFVETIPYKETREYVARVLAFSVVYDWRLNGNALPLSDRLAGSPPGGPSPRRPFSCPLPSTKGT